MLTYIADILLAAGALAAAFYCMVLSRRLRRFADLDKGVGGAVAVLSVQVDDMTRTIRQAEKSAAELAVRLNGLTERSEDAARRLELMIAAMHDLPVADPAPAAPQRAPAAEPAAQTGTQTGTQTGAQAGTQAGAEPRKEPPLTAETPRQSIFTTRRTIGEQAGGEQAA